MTSVRGFPETGPHERQGPPATLDAARRERTICVVAREPSNTFEGDMHLPLAAAAGAPAAPRAALDAGRLSPSDLRADLALARTVTSELVGQHRLSDEIYLDALKPWSEPRGWSW
jgi:4-carboxymuconolactone decarboxylase